MALTLEVATDDDWSELLSWHAQDSDEGRALNQYLEPWTPESVAQYRADPYATVFAVFEDGEMVAYVERLEWEIEADDPRDSREPIETLNVGVKPGRWGQGIATRTLQAFFRSDD